MRVMLSTCALVIGSVQIGSANSLRLAAETAADWAISQGNAASLADSIEILLETGGSLDPDDVFTVVHLSKALSEMDGGPELLDRLRSLAPRGQIGGAPRQDMKIPAGDTRKLTFEVMTQEPAFVELRLKRASGDADIDLWVMSQGGAVIGKDVGPETGTRKAGNFVEFWPTKCENITLEISNNGPEVADLAVLIPQTSKTTCVD